MLLEGNVTSTVLLSGATNAIRVRTCGGSTSLSAAVPGAGRLRIFTCTPDGCRTTTGSASVPSTTL